MSKIDSGGIFVSYRRQDTPHVAGRLFDRLAERFGRSHVFMDVVSIEPGFDFAEVINEAINGCDVLLVLIGQSWLSAVDEHGRRRLENPEDLVLLEVKAALDQRVRVIPVLVDGTSAPRRDELPEVIAGLTRRNCVRLDHETFGSDVGVLMDFLERTIRLDSGRSEAGPSLVGGQDDVGPGYPANYSPQSYSGVGDVATQGQTLPLPATEAVTTAAGSEPTGAARAAPGATLTEPTRMMEATGAVNERAVRAALAIALAVLAIPVVAGLIIDSKQLGDALGVLGLSLFFLMIAGVVVIWILHQPPHEEKGGLKSFWISISILAPLLVIIPGTIVVPRLVDFWNNTSSHPADRASPTGIAPPTSLPVGPPPRWPEGKSPIQLKDVNVQAVEDWHDTGILLKEGQTVRIVASGQWSPFTPRLFDGRGCLDVKICSQDPNQPDNICCMAHAGLLGRIGSTNPFAVGVGTLMSVPNSGKLYFRINDLRQGDNAGQLVVTVQVFS